jgi:hypothetical protein
VSEFRLGFAHIPLPQAAMEALARGKIDTWDLAIIAALWRGARWETRRRVITLARLAEAIGWNGQDDTLYRRLLKLRRLGFHEYETTPGRHGARYVFALNPEPTASPEQSEDVPRRKPLNHAETAATAAPSVPRRPSSSPRSEEVGRSLAEPDSSPPNAPAVPRTSDLQRETKACSEETVEGPGSTDQDHAVGEGTPDLRQRDLWRGAA